MPVLRLSALLLSAALVPGVEPVQIPLEESSPWLGVAGSIGGLILAAVQLVVGLTIAAFCIKRGLDLLTDLLGGLDVWEQIRRKNIAVGILGAGVVISFTHVVSEGIAAMGRALMTLGADPIGGLIALLAGLMNLLIAITLAPFAIRLVFRIMDRFTTRIDERKEFAEGNISLGVVYAGIMVGVSSLVATGISAIGLAIFQALTAIWHAVA